MLVGYQDDLLVPALGRLASGLAGAAVRISHRVCQRNQGLHQCGERRVGCMNDGDVFAQCFLRVMLKHDVSTQNLRAQPSTGATRE